MFDTTKNIISCLYGIISSEKVNILKDNSIDIAYTKLDDVIQSNRCIEAKISKS